MGNRKAAARERSAKDPVGPLLAGTRPFVATLPPGDRVGAAAGEGVVALAAVVADHRAATTREREGGDHAIWVRWVEGGVANDWGCEPSDRKSTGT